MSEMEQACIKSTNLEYLNKLTKLDLLMIDDFGLMDLDFAFMYFTLLDCFIAITQKALIR